MKNKVRSPFFYVGDKYKLMPQLVQYFPKNINQYIEPFVGGGSSFLSVEANSYMLNDINSHIIELHKFFVSYCHNSDVLIDKILQQIKISDLTCSYAGKNVSEDIKKLYPKTYYAKSNKAAYNLLKDNYNKEKDKDLIKLYILLIYGFNHMIRFNKKGEFNLPVGNVDFNKNVVLAISNYTSFTENKNLEFFNNDYVSFVEELKFSKNDFVYIDPPYLVSSSEYNKLWSEEQEIRLYELCDYLDSQNVYFGLSNLLFHKSKKNNILDSWYKKYNSFDISSNYISRFDNTIKTKSKEIYITNYAK
jgi:DNA adenine methylase